MGVLSRRAWRGAVVAGAVAAVAVLAGCGPLPLGDPVPDASTELSAEAQTRMRDAVTAAMAKAQASGAIVGVWAPWAGNWVEGIGATEPGGSTPPSVDATFRVGTAGASMTCAVLLRLVDEGRVGLDDPLDEYLTRQPGIEGITLRQLCQNNSGIADYVGPLRGTFIDNPTRLWPATELIANGLVRSPLAPAGQAYSASSTGYLLLGRALRAETSSEWDALYRDQLFAPAGLSATSFPSARELELADGALSGYAYALDGGGAPRCDVLETVPRLSNSMLEVAGGQVSTVTDLKRYLELLLDGALLSEESTAELTATIPVAADAPAWRSMGLGVMQLGPLYGTSGWIPGTLTSMYHDPASGLTIVVALNNSSAGTDFVEALALQLASISAELPAASGGTGGAAVAAMPWAEQEQIDRMNAGAVCQPPPPA